MTDVLEFVSLSLMPPWCWRVAADWLRRGDPPAIISRRLLTRFPRDTADSRQRHVVHAHPVLAGHERVPELMHEDAGKNEEDEEQREDDRPRAVGASQAVPVDQHPEKDERKRRVQTDFDIVHAGDCH